MKWLDWLIKPKLSDLARDCFNKYQDYFTGLDPCDETLDITLKIRIRAFGSEKVKQAAWDKAWRTPKQQAKRDKPWGPVAAGVSVSSKIPEIWCDLRVTRAGLVLPLGVLSHKMLHTLRQEDRRVINPDLLIDKGTY